jgi:hypothetical protein
MSTAVTEAMTKNNSRHCNLERTSQAGSQKPGERNSSEHSERWNYKEKMAVSVIQNRMHDHRRCERKHRRKNQKSDFGLSIQINGFSGVA